jgi:hypothetical protein
MKTLRTNAAVFPAQQHRSIPSGSALTMHGTNHVKRLTPEEVPVQARKKAARLIWEGD